MYDFVHPAHYFAANTLFNILISSRCYTNHALDQFLEHLDAVGIEKIIRIGGHSSSRILEGKNLRLVSLNEGRTGSEQHLLGSSHEKMELQERIVRSKLRILHELQKTSKDGLNAHLHRMYPHIHSQFSRVDSE